MVKPQLQLRRYFKLVEHISQKFLELGLLNVHTGQEISFAALVGGSGVTVTVVLLFRFGVDTAAAGGGAGTTTAVLAVPAGPACDKWSNRHKPKPK